CRLSRASIAQRYGARNKDIKKSLCPLTGSALLAETGLDQGHQGLDRLGALRSLGLELDYRAGAGRQHHEPHDGGAADRLAVAHHAHGGIEALRTLHELGGGAGMQPLAVADRHFRPRFVVFPHGTRLPPPQASPDRTWLATLMYLRPASFAAFTAAARLASPRTLASLISMGRLMPASTSAPVSDITEIARLEGVPPNMSVSTMTPLPVSTRRTASISSIRRASTSSSGPIESASSCSWGPTTCSRAARNSPAKPP